MADAEANLRKLLDTSLDNLGYKPREVTLNETTSGGANYTSALFIIDVTSPGKPDLHLFAKVACVAEKLREQMGADVFYKTEDLIYNKLMKFYDNLQIKHEIPEEHRLVFPKLIACSLTFGQETFIFENLYKKGYDMYSRFKSIDWEHAEIAVSNLAKLHALSFALEREYPEVFSELAVEKKFSESRKEAQKAFEASIAKAVATVENEEFGMRVVKFLQEETSEDRSGSKRGDFPLYYRPLGTKVIVHGDYRISNIMFKREDGHLSSIILDYQIVHGGCPLSDLLYFVALGTDEQFRKKHFDQLLQHYYSELTLALNRFGIDVGEVYPKKQFDKELSKALPFVLLLALLILPVITVEAANAPNVAGSDAELSHFIVEPSEIYAERLNGLVRDCVKWGII